jgi:hypothetical protein
MGLRQGLRAGRQDWPLDKELQMLARGWLCGPEERRRCRAESGAFAEWACAVCAERVRPEAISPWTWHLVFLYRLSRAGYPFKANDLSLETWLLMGTVGRVLEGAQRGRHGYD